jgi:hypothetical protein
MPLAIILGASLWLLSPSGSSAAPLGAIVGLQTAQVQESQAGASNSENSPAPPAVDQQKASGQAETQPPAAASPPCSENSPAGAVGNKCAPPKTAGRTVKKHHPTHKAVAPAGTDPTKTVIRNGGAAEPTVDLSPSVSDQQASHQLDETNKRLATADANLKTLAGRQLNATQQDTVKQIKSYMDQAESAKSSGDIERAYNLAVKANLLSAELAGH